LGLTLTSHYESWDILVEDILSCTKCRLHMSRRKAVPGDGRRDAEIMLIGEAPGATEDELGLPFVGAAGKLLDSVLEDIGLKRSDLYITNVVKCRPPNNRQPARDEIESCSLYLESQILMIRPKVIVTLGSVAGEWVASKMGIRWLGVTRMRGNIYRGDMLGIEISLIPTYHPAAILRNKGNMEDLKADLRIAVEELARIKGSKRSSEEKEERKGGKKTLLDYMKL